MNHRLAGTLAVATMALFAVAAPVSAGPPPPQHRIVDDDGKAGLTDTGAADCSDGFDSTSAPGVVFSTVSAAVSAANPGDTIFVCPGTYNENVAITKKLTISGPWAGQSAATCNARSDQATIIGVGAGPALSVAADRVIIAGLRVANTAGTGIWTSGSFSGYRIKDNVISHNATGVDFNTSGLLAATVLHNCIRDNNTGGPGRGVRSTGTLSNATVVANRFSDHRIGAVVLGPAHDVSVNGNWSTDDRSFLSATSIQSMQVMNNRIGTTTEISTPDSAVVIAGASMNVTVMSNSIDSNHTDGVLVKDTATNIQVNANKIRHVTNGIRITTTAYGAVRAQNNTIVDVQGTLSASAVGINLGAATSGNRITRNKVLGVADTHCLDDSIGTDTAGTANHWVANKGAVSSPGGICTP